MAENGVILENSVEQPLTFSMAGSGIRWNSPAGESADASVTDNAAVLLDCRRLLWKTQPAGGGLCASVPPMSSTTTTATTVPMPSPTPPPPPSPISPPTQSEVAYRQWLVRRYQRQFLPYAESGGIPNRLFLELFNRPHIDEIAGGRSRKLARLLRRAEADRRGRTDWVDFYAGMTYRMRAEVAPVKRLVNRLVRAADPGVAAAERRLRQRRIGRPQRRRERRHQRLDDDCSADSGGGCVPEEAYIELYRCRPPPVFVPLALLALLINFSVCAVQLNAGPDWNRVGWAAGLPFSSPLAFCPARRHEVWRFVTYALLHDGWHHLAFNSAAFLLLGLPLQLAHGGLPVAAVMLGGVLLGSMLSSVAEPGAVLVGAAGAAYALIGAHIGLALANWGQLSAEWRDITSPGSGGGGGGSEQKTAGKLRRLLNSSMLRLVLLAGLVYVDFAVAIYQRHWRRLGIFAGDGGGRIWHCGISYAAHPAGLAWGLLIGAQLLRIDDSEDAAAASEEESAVGQRRRCCRRATLLGGSLASFAGFALFAILWNVFNTSWYAATGCLACGSGAPSTG